MGSASGAGAPVAIRFGRTGEGGRPVALVHGPGEDDRTAAHRSDRSAQDQAEATRHG
ncbi:hypothetical protein ACIBCA_26935 [Kitasatospora sp. NPDC051170]|uniref:hypothetical protein n=1 Tax=Kitasatospora sp. NPDC051170 TaxID=3364056 RepID=UPI0037A99E6A